MLSAVRPMLLSGRCAAAAAGSRSSIACFSSTRDQEGSGSGAQDKAGTHERFMKEKGINPGSWDDGVTGPGPHNDTVKDLGVAEGGTLGGIAGPVPHKDSVGQAEGGTLGGIAGATVGGDDMAGDASAGTVADDVGMKVDADDGLPPGPNETSGPAAQARAGGFGQTRDPQAAEDKDAPADLAQRAKEEDNNTQDATTPKPWSS